MMAIRLPLIAAALLLVTSAGASGPKPDYQTADGRFRIVGYNDMDEMLTAAASRIEAGPAGFRFEFDLNSTRSAPAALVAGRSLLAPMGAEMDPADRAAFHGAWGSDPIEFRIAHDSLTRGTLSSPTGILVARGNPLRRITLDQVRRIFTDQPGRPAISTWRALGIASAAGIRPIGLAADTAIGRFTLNALRADRYAVRFEGMRQSRDAAAIVAADPTAIALANLNFAGPDVRALTIIDDRRVARVPTRAGIRSGRYPFDRFLLIYARQEADGGIAPAARMLLESLLSPEGQAAIGRQSRGYIPLNRRELAYERIKLAKTMK
ncbi:MAG: substrate-binding domain-containing protein [Sphingomonas sp.]